MRGKDLFMRSLIPSLNLSKRQKFVLTVLFMSIGIFISTYLSGINLIITSIFLSFLGIILLYFTLRSDISGTFYYPILILPFFFTISFSLFYPLIPARLLTRIIVVLLYAFGLYSLFLTQNIFAVSAIRTITLLRSARIVSFVLTIVVLFLLTNIIFSLRLSFFVGIQFVKRIHSRILHIVSLSIPCARSISFCFKSLARNGRNIFNFYNRHILCLFGPYTRMDREEAVQRNTLGVCLGRIPSNSHLGFLFQLGFLIGKSITSTTCITSIKSFFIKSIRLGRYRFPRDTTFDTFDTLDTF